MTPLPWLVVKKFKGSSMISIRVSKGDAVKDSMILVEPSKYCYEEVHNMLVISEMVRSAQIRWCRSNEWGNSNFLVWDKDFYYTLFIDHCPTCLILRAVEFLICGENLVNPTAGEFTVLLFSGMELNRSIFVLPLVLVQDTTKLFFCKFEPCPTSVLNENEICRPA